MDTIISKCGIICSDCGAYKATLSNDDELRRQTAQEWEKMFNGTIDPATVNCLGCQEQDNSKVFNHCTVCKIRSCASDKGHATCADCAEYGCELVKGVWDFDASIKSNLDTLRR